MIKVKGIGLTQFGELWDKDLKDLIKEAADKALDDAGMDVNEIESVYIGSMLCGEVSEQSNLGGIFSEIYGVNIPVSRVEAACASGGMASYTAIQAIKSGSINNALVIGVEKMTDIPANQMSELLMQAGAEDERTAGATFPSLFGMMTQAHMNKFGTTIEQLHFAAMICHRNAANNPLAQFKHEVSEGQIACSADIAEPLKMLHCSPISDGAAAIVLSNEEKSTDDDAFILNESLATDTISLAERENLYTLKSTQIASKQLFANSEVSIKDIGAVELHDCFSIAACMALEDIGFVDKGKGGEALEKIYNGDNKLPTLNPSGGLKASGHPVGATGVKQIAEIALQIRGQAGDRQVKDMTYGLTHNIGGSGGTTVMHLIGKI